MTDSEDTDALAAKHEQNRAQRLEEIERWVTYIKNNPPDVWGPQLNSLIESQLSAARDSNLSAAHYDHVEQTAQELFDAESEADQHDS